MKCPKCGADSYIIGLPNDFYPGWFACKAAGRAHTWSSKSDPAFDETRARSKAKAEELRTAAAAKSTGGEPSR